MRSAAGTVTVRALPVEVHEAELREDPERAAGLRRRPLRIALAERRLELLARRGPPVPEGPVDRGERGTKVVLSLMDRHCEGYLRLAVGQMDHRSRRDGGAAAGGGSSSDDVRVARRERRVALERGVRR